MWEAILETLLLLSHPGPCEQFQGLAPVWASMIGGPKKGVLKWKREAEVIFSQAGRMPDKLPSTAPISNLSSRTSSLCCLPGIWHAGGHLERILST